MRINRIKWLENHSKSIWSLQIDGKNNKNPIEAYWSYTNKWSIQSADIFIDWIVLFERDQYIETTSNPFYSTYVSML